MSSIVGKGVVGKAVIITGSSAGIGRSTAKLFAKHQSRVVLTGRREDALKEALQECVQEGAKPENVVYVVADLNESDGIKAIIDKAVSSFNRIDVLVNNAGIYAETTVEDTSMETFDKIINTNVRSIFQLTKLAIPHLKKSQGNVVNVSSINSLCSFQSSATYCMSKAALDSFTGALALELAPYKVRVNSVNPGEVVTGILVTAGGKPEDIEKYYEGSAAFHPLGRNGRTEEVADLIVYLASESATFITGAKVPVDGGLSVTSSYYRQQIVGQN